MSLMEEPTTSKVDKKVKLQNSSEHLHLNLMKQCFKNFQNSQN